MSETTPQTDQKVPEGAAARLRPEELPPVEPPSAGYIVQLFLIPALIVAAVIGVWALFGMLANEETDSRQLVAELGSSNEHRRWRAALGLAQVLRNQQIAPDANGQPLAEQPHVIEGLTNLLKESLSSVSEDDIKHQEFLARTMGSLRSDEDVLPVLALAISPEKNIEVRKSGLMSLAMIAGRHFNAAAGKGTDSTETSPDETVTLENPLPAGTINNEDVLQQLKLAAQDESPGVRHLAAFVLGLVSGEDAINQLKVLLLDGDDMARANAAVGLARNGLTDGVPTLINLVSDASEEMDRDDFAKLSKEDQQSVLKKRQFEKPMILSNCMRALDSLIDKTTEEDHTKITAAVTSLLDSGPPSNIKLQAQQLLEKVDK